MTPLDYSYQLDLFTMSTDIHLNDKVLVTMKKNLLDEVLNFVNFEIFLLYIHLLDSIFV